MNSIWMRQYNSWITDRPYCCWKNLGESSPGYLLNKEVLKFPLRFQLRSVRLMKEFMQEVLGLLEVPSRLKHNRCSSHPVAVSDGFSRPLAWTCASGHAPTWRIVGATPGNSATSGRV